MSAISTVFSDLKANKELIPLVTFVGSAVTFGVAAMIHTSVSAKDVVFHHRSNPFPWQSTNQPATPPVTVPRFFLATPSRAGCNCTASSALGRACIPCT
ncbi:hypothetical protein CAOG_02285 [Capsaspora owczarzaki ATCC 30864]|uniref:hypothetical protein n=1 Tax=Capsaspora owczarzaki (strain ATCC 30864) TaxID=595528 RepID=UPI0003524DC3|nr:hypothetical protein CAOG_02285 [Capsaspora owczarzaki ATCC 30864]|eukprot:XP_004349035.2 hypothetical protein CAOG_02285 [Capsaspora owczarzaki ATCC 30864]